MTTLEALGRRALKCSQWLWVPGMSYFHNGEFHRNSNIPLDAYPDLGDSATRHLLGDIIARVRKGDQIQLDFVSLQNAFSVAVLVRDYKANVLWHDFYRTGVNHPVAEALVLALENAGGK